MAKLSVNDTISSEYKDELNKKHKNEKWGVTGAKYSGGAIWNLLRTRKYLLTALDYGAGRGSVAQAFPDISWTEYDPGILEKSIRPNGRFDLVTCTDVMEHVEIEYVDAVIADLAEYTGKVLFMDIACFPTNSVFASGPYEGEDVHITVREPQWWIDKFDEAGLLKHETQVITKRTKGGYRERVQLIYERV